MNDPFEVFDFKDEKDWLSGRMVEAMRAQWSG